LWLNKRSNGAEVEGVGVASARRISGSEAAKKKPAQKWAGFVEGSVWAWGLGLQT